MSELHEIRTDTPNWDTKQRCTCGYESVSKCEQHKHASDALRSQANRDRAVVEAAREVREFAVYDEGSDQFWVDADLMNDLAVKLDAIRLHAHE